MATVTLLCLSLSLPGSAFATDPVITAIQQGPTSSMALDANGTLWYWGSNFAGESGSIGNNSNPESLYVAYPVIVKNVSGIESMCSGGHFCVALDRNHTLWTWGTGIFGTLGRDFDNSMSLSYSTPGAIRSIPNVTALSVGNEFVAVLTDDNTVWTWGNHYYGQLGNGTNITCTEELLPSISRTNPDRISYLENVTSISCGPYNVIALTRDGRVWVWGSTNVYLLGAYGKRNYGQLIGQQGTAVPIPIDGIGQASSASIGHGFAVILKDDGMVWGWGSNSHGELGTSDYSETYYPAIIPGVHSITQIITGDYHVLALDDTGAVWSWGSNRYGQLGDGTTTNRYAPVKLNLPRIKAISAKGYNSMALDEDGGVWAWGSNTYGQLGNGERGNRFVDDYPYSSVPRKVIFDRNTLLNKTMNVSSGQTVGGSQTTSGFEVLSAIGALAMITTISGYLRKRDH
ncbi:RCC1 domain-containing protein [Methanocella sp. MCL-LM]|uniref:RCC1 domain-containing protein n=1 Tax=Methanocella sp. MCL-LM TaxID=3412035 RepID=UPI003C736926